MMIVLFLVLIHYRLSHLDVEELYERNLTKV